MGGSTAAGIGLMRPLEATARKIGVEIMLKTRMTAIIREQPMAGRVIGITPRARAEDASHYIAEGVIIGTGGSTSNAISGYLGSTLTRVPCGVAGEPYSRSGRSGELAAMAIAASVWGGYKPDRWRSASTYVMPGISLPVRIPVHVFPHGADEPPSQSCPGPPESGSAIRQNTILINKAGKHVLRRTARPQYTQNTTSV